MREVGNGSRDLSPGIVVRPTVAPLALCALLLASGDAIAAGRQATPEDLRAGFCIPFIQQRYDVASLSVKVIPNERTKELHQRYELMLNKLRRFILARIESFSDESLGEFLAAMDSGAEEKNRIDKIKDSCISESLKEAGPPNDRIFACLKRRNVEVTKYEECERMDFLPY